MSNYEAIAKFYDRLSDEGDYKKLCKYIDSLLKKHSFKGNRLLDVACGTGTLTHLLSSMGYDMIGTDESEDMLFEANRKYGSEDILFINQSAQELDLYGEVDGAVCTFDSINHITDKDGLVKAFSKISLFTVHGGLFIFDVNTVYKHRKILGNNSFVLQDDGVFCAWQNEYEEKTHTVNMELDFFCKNGNAYTRTTQLISERAYTKSELCALLKKGNFEALAFYDNLSFEEPNGKSERIFCVAKNLGGQMPTNEKM